MKEKEGNFTRGNKNTGTRHFLGIRKRKKKLEKLQSEEQKKLQEKIKLEEWKLLLALKLLPSSRLPAEQRSRAEVSAGRRGWS